jgi:hypothetical protein
MITCGLGSTLITSTCQKRVQDCEPDAKHLFSSKNQAFVWEVSVYVLAMALPF